MQKVQALTDVTYDQIERKAGAVFDMQAEHADLFTKLGKVMKAEDETQPQNERRSNRYKTRRLQAEE